MPTIPVWLPLCTLVTGFMLGVLIARLTDLPHA